MNDTIQRIREVLQRDHTDANKLETIAEILDNHDKCPAYKEGAKCVRRDCSLVVCAHTVCRIKN